MKLINSETKKEVKIGSVVFTFRGERYYLVGMREPHKASSTGKVYCNTTNRNDFNSREWFPSVIGCEFVD